MTAKKPTIRLFTITTTNSLESSQPMYEFRVAFKIAHDSTQRDDVFFSSGTLEAPPRMRKYLFAS